MTIPKFNRAVFDSRLHAVAAPLLTLSSSNGRNCAPPMIHAPYTMLEWRALTWTARREHLERQVIHALASEDDPLTGSLQPALDAANAYRAHAEEKKPRRAAAHPAPVAPTPVLPPATEVPPAVDAPTSSSGYVVSCAGGCGEWLAARGPRPAVLYCEDPCRPPKRKRKRRPSVETK